MTEEGLRKKKAQERAQEKLERIKVPLEVALLDEISRGIKLVAERLEAQVPEGIKDEATFTVSGKNAIAVRPTRTTPPFIRVTVFNDGPDSVYVFLNDIPPESTRQAPLNSGDKADIDTTEAKIRALFVACVTSTGTASGRVWFLK
jgi:hypothetical protein